MSARSAPNSYAPTLDEMVEVTFTVSPRVRKIGAHSPDDLPLAEYFRQIYWGSGVDLPEENYEALVDDFVSTTSNCAPGEKARAVDAAAGGIHHRLRAGDAFGAIHRRQGRADARAAEPVDLLRSGPYAEPDHRDAARAAAPGGREPHRQARAAERLHRRRSAARHDRQATAVPDRQAATLQPDVSRPLPDRYARRRPAAEDHQPDLPVHRSARLDRALRASRRPRGVRSGAGAFPGAARDRRGRSRRGGEDHRRRGDGDVSDAGPRGCRGAADARRDAGSSTRRAGARTCS